MKANLALGEFSLWGRDEPVLQSAVLPDDLRASVSEQTLVRLALEAVQTVEWPKVASWQKSSSERMLPGPLLTTVLIYSYAIGVLGSRDIELLARQDRFLRYLCGSTVPDWDTLRLFRRQHVRLVTECLKILIERVWKELRSNGSAFASVTSASQEPFLDRRGTTTFEPDFAREAEQRVTRAIHADSMAMDD